MNANLIVALFLGLAGSVHCVGMCGGFALLSASKTGTVQRPSSAVSVYLLGKTLTYALLGALLGGSLAALLGSTGGDIPSSIPWIQKGISIATGLFLIVIGLHITGHGPNWNLVAPSAASSLVSRMARAVHDSTLKGRFLLGMVNGLLPCGLVYGALGYALSAPGAIDSALFMAVFGLGTAPALILIGYSAAWLNTDRRASVYYWLGWMIVALGVLTVLRGTPLMGLIM